MTWAAAKPLLDQAGLRYGYDHGADGPQAFLITVRSTDPKSGTTVHRGDTIKVRFTG
jgi:beta-lactam-binding protein with PASTA domain